MGVKQLLTANRPRAISPNGAEKGHCQRSWINRNVRITNVKEISAKKARIGKTLRRLTSHYGLSSEIMDRQKLLTVTHFSLVSLGRSVYDRGP